jgi:hypothetical protein
MRPGVGLIVAVVAAAGLSGCGGGGPKLVAVTGTVTLNGKPLEGAEVVFLPDVSNPNGLPGNDVTGPAGNYKVMTQGRSGLVPGKYKVVVKKSTVDVSKVPEEFKDDPYMVSLATEDPGGKKPRKADKPNEIKGEFERDVPEAGGVQDFDVKAKPG